MMLCRLQKGVTCILSLRRKGSCHFCWERPGITSSNLCSHSCDEIFTDIVVRNMMLFSSVVGLIQKVSGVEIVSVRTQLFLV